MVHSNGLMLAAAAAILACSQHTPPAPASKLGPDIKLIERGTPSPAGTRLAIQFNDEPPVIHVADGRGGPPILYHGRELDPNKIRSIGILKLNEAREKFADPTLDAGVLIQLK
jgi:hypothetical protein